MSKKKKDVVDRIKKKMRDKKREEDLKRSLSTEL